MQRCRKNHIVALVVPGRDDRTFYKWFLRRVAELLSRCCGENIDYIDLDARQYAAEKRKLVEEIVPGGRGLEKWAAVSLAMNDGRRVDVLIGLPAIEALQDMIDTRIRDPVAAAAAALIGMLAVRRSSRFRLLVVADDAEGYGFAERLQRLENNIFNVYLHRFLSSGGAGINIAWNTVDFDETGHYYKLVNIGVRGSGYSFKVLLLVQGLEASIVGGVFPQLAQADRRALEDFIVYAAGKYVAQIPDECLDALLGGERRRLHKKIVRLLTLALCHYELESAMSALLGPKGVERLLMVHGGLRRLVDEIAVLLCCRGL